MVSGGWPVRAGSTPRNRPPPPALPARDGVGASFVVLPAGPWPRMLDFLVERLPAVSAQEWADRMARGDVFDARGQPVAPHQPYAPHGKLYYYRSLPAEAPNPAQARVLFEDELLVVADKPHFLPVIPTGKYLQETLLIRLRRQTGVDTLTAVHRLDRETAGLVLLVKQPQHRRHYTALFAERAVHKTYQAIALWRPELPLPATRESTLVDAEHFMRMQELPADHPQGATPNALTHITLLETQGPYARYRLQPLTGKRHQLRVHMAALGRPICGDRIYPELLPENTDDRDNPLRLLAEAIAFDDPVTGQARRFESRQVLVFPENVSR